MLHGVLFLSPSPANRRRCVCVHVYCYDCHIWNHIGAGSQVAELVPVSAVDSLRFSLFFHLLLWLCVFVRADLHAAWKAKSAYFFCALALTIVSSLLYLLASLVDPGTLPKATLDKKLLASFRSQALEAGTMKVSQRSLAGLGLRQHMECGCCTVERRLSSFKGFKLYFVAWAAAVFNKSFMRCICHWFPHSHTDNFHLCFRFC